MHRPVRTRAIALFAGIAYMLATFAMLPPAPALAQGGKEAAARALILDTWTASHAADLYTEARRYFHSTAVPIIRDYKSGKLKLPIVEHEPLLGAFFDEAFNLVLLVEDASGEFDAAIEKHNEELQADLARLLAKHFSGEEIESLHGALRLALPRKGFDALYKIYRISFSLNYEEELANQRFAIWAQEILLEYAKRNWQLNPTPATPKRVATATAIVNDFMTGIRLDETVADGLRLAREVILPLEQNADIREQQRQKIDEFEKQYNTWKPAAWIAAYTALATALSEEQLDILQQHMRGPGIAKLYKMLVEAEKAWTAFTLADIEATKTYFESAKARGLFRERTADEKAAFDADAKVLAEKWGPRLAESISPQKRDALIQSFIKLWALANTPNLYKQFQQL